VSEWTDLGLPNPGSREAGERGCVCAVMDNSYGKGVPYPRDDGLDPNEYPSFWVTVGCPVHSPAVGVVGEP
jgi:hypothetical protein